MARGFHRRHTRSESRAHVVPRLSKTLYRENWPRTLFGEGKGEVFVLGSRYSQGTVAVVVLTAHGARERKNAGMSREPWVTAAISMGPRDAR